VYASIMPCQHIDACFREFPYAYGAIRLTAYCFGVPRMVPNVGPAMSGIGILSALTMPSGGSA
jgi:hypothetical protein